MEVEVEVGGELGARQRSRADSCSALPRAVPIASLSPLLEAQPCRVCVCACVRACVVLSSPRSESPFSSLFPFLFPLDLLWLQLQVRCC